MKPQQIPNILTCMRLFLVIPFLVSLAHASYQVAFYIFLTAGVSDALDGYLARAFDWRTRLGSILDPLADKLLLVSAFTALAWSGQILMWLLVLVLARDITLIIGSIVLHNMMGPYQFFPTMISKINTCFQIIFIALILVHLGFDLLPGVWMHVIVAIVTVTTALSFVDYMWCWGTRAFMQNKGTNG